MTSPAELYKQSIAIAFAEKAAHAVETSLPEDFLRDHEILVEPCVTDAGDPLIVLVSDKEGVNRLAEIFGGKAIQIWCACWQGFQICGHGDVQNGPARA